MWALNVLTDMKEYTFSKCHPAVNLLFFVGAICFSTFLQHPLYLIANIFASSTYYLLLNGTKGIKGILGILPLFLFITLLNPIINTRGDTILYIIFDRPYTLEALIYGATLAIIFLTMVLWLGCYSKIMTIDKFSSILGNFMPSIALLLVMLFRMIPNLIHKTKTIIAVRNSIEKVTKTTSKLNDKLTFGITVLGVMTSLALEGGVTTSDSMRARGYGSTKRTSFKIYKMSATDWSIIAIMLILSCVIISFALNGNMHAQFFPHMSIASIKGQNILAFLAYLGFLIIPTVLQIKETLQWNILKYKI